MISLSTSTYSRRIPLHLSVAVGGLLLIVTCCPVTYADDLRDFEAYKKNLLAPLQTEFSKIVDSHSDDPAVSDFRQRVALIEEVARLLVDRFQATKSSSLEGLLSDIADVPSAPVSRAVAANTVSALDVLAEYQGIFAKTLPKPAVTEKEMQVLLQYYNTLAQAAGTFIAERGQPIAKIDEKTAGDIVELCVVVPFLHVPDEKWSRDQIDSLPDWMKRSDYIASLENFSLRVRRPYTGYGFSVHKQPRNAKDTLAYAEYLRSAADRMITDREYHAGIHCLKVGIGLAEQEKRDEQAIDLHLQLADVLNNAGHAPLAAEEIKQTLDKYAKSSEYGKGTTLRLKYLYEAGQFAKILEEAPTYQADERCKPYLPQIIYISWVAHRRENKLAEADKLQKDFLEKFPEHPLAADMYFAAAMTALAKSDYEETSRLLEIIQYRYPKSKIIDKAKQIQERLKQNLGQNITK